MKRAGLALGVLGGAMLLLVGCTSLDLGFDLMGGSSSASGNVRIMDGSPQVVALSLQDTFKRQGFSDVRIVLGADGKPAIVEAKAVGGLGCAFLLKSVVGPDGKERTHATLQWMAGENQTLSVQVLADVDKQPGTKKQ
jgi:hypothetical protein